MPSFIKKKKTTPVENETELQERVEAPTLLTRVTTWEQQGEWHGDTRPQRTVESGTQGMYEWVRKAHRRTRRSPPSATLPGWREERESSRTWKTLKGHAIERKQPLGSWPKKSMKQSDKEWLRSPTQSKLRIARNSGWRPKPTNPPAIGTLAPSGWRKKQAGSDKKEERTSGMPANQGLISPWGTT